MKAIYLALATPLLLTACAEEQSPAQFEKAAEKITAEEDEAAVKAEQKNIEAAADAAAKLVEEEARAEIEQFQADEAEAAAEE